MYSLNQKVSLEDLRPSLDPDHVCRGSVPLKNGILTCGCPIRADAPEPITHRDVANFDNLSIETLRIKIIEQYMPSVFNNCRNQKLKIMANEEPLRLFVDPKVKPVAIHKAAVIPVYLKEAVKADLD